jgi:hypothetical protein
MKHQLINLACGGVDKRCFLKPGGEWRLVLAEDVFRGGGSTADMRCSLSDYCFCPDHGEVYKAQVRDESGRLARREWGCRGDGRSLQRSAGRRGLCLNFRTGG